MRTRSLRIRIVAVTLLLLAVVSALIAGVTTIELRGYLLSQLDEDVRVSSALILRTGPAGTVATRLIAAWPGVHRGSDDGAVADDGDEAVGRARQLAEVGRRCRTRSTTSSRRSKTVRRSPSTWGVWAPTGWPLGPAVAVSWSSPVRPKPGCTTSWHALSPSSSSSRLSCCSARVLRERSWWAVRCGPWSGWRPPRRG